MWLACALDVQVIDQSIQLGDADSCAKAAGLRTNTKTLGTSESLPEGIVHDMLERLSALRCRLLKLTREIVVDRKSRAHGDILMHRSANDKMVRQDAVSYTHLRA